MDVLFNKAFDLYKASFPEHEQRLFEDQIVALNHSEYHCDIILEKDVFVGIIFYWETSEYTYIKHFAIDPGMRGNHVGSRCLQKFYDLHNLVILEIDPPVESISIRRKNFYMRPKQNVPHELVIMSLPRRISEFEYSQFNEYLVKTIMKSDV
ncbi:GNAT family N-acetyltransferase [Brevibacillus laterosporus]|uniref:GNAT family N-acetyltransferase n=1 Tax=Brevibacillus laterosporus TaxID=1465 RepID=UPI00215C879B|nr:GNAT family N-acetyltransferase [Brevibacillus laterosporus]MCR8993707.1 GNAT family N-acetyltransferase [Brevibacillus laterosporus]